ncbi:MAG: geranylgeranylglycerol-phosphate geranylgeranyltransferase [Bacteroidota bacterium]|nr:geranylgeranylglycerol-phosphate geranylgeranyltransferase [Bacteroidota bacterium]
MINYCRLFRCKNLLIVVLTQLLVYKCLIIDNSKLSYFETEFIFLMIATVLITAAGYLINDFYDVETDKINRPGKNIIDDKIGINTVLIIYTLLNAISLFIGFKISIQLGLIFLSAIILLLFYSAYFKSVVLTGNIIVSMLSALTVLVVWYYKPESNFFIIAFYVFFAFMTSLLREIIKDIEDVEGDSKTNVNTFAVIYGIKASKWVANILLWILMLSVLFFIVLNFISYLGFVVLFLLIFVLIPLLFLMYKIRKASIKKDFTYMSKVIKLIMIAGILSMIFYKL